MSMTTRSAALDETVVEVIVKRRRVRSRADDRRERRAVGAIAAKGVLDERLNLKLIHPRCERLHRVALGASVISAA